MDGLRGEQLKTLFRWFKEGPPGAVPIERDGRSLGVLVAVTWEDAGCAAAVARLATWHEQASAEFPPAFAVSATGARQWLVECVLQSPDRVLFWIKDVRGEAVGHVGLSDLDAETGEISISDTLCGQPESHNLVAVAVARLREWVSEALHLRLRQECDRLVAA